jgi:hypothetical protein
LIESTTTANSDESTDCGQVQRKIDTSMMGVLRQKTSETASSSSLIVVASLIDKPSNLGGEQQNTFKKALFF